MNPNTTPREQASSYGEYAADDLSPDDERDHVLYVRRIAEEHGFPLTDWVPTIP